MSTVLDLKKTVAKQLGKTDYATANTKRDLAIIDGIRQYTNEHEWEWNKKTVPVSFSGNYGTIPADMNSKYVPKLYTYDGVSRTDWDQVGVLDVPSYQGSSTAVFAIDYNSSQIYSNVEDGVIAQVEYQKIPVEPDLSGSDDSDVLPMPDITPVARLIIGLYWQSVERDDENFDRYMEKVYGPLLRKAIVSDKRSMVTRITRRRNLGWNR